MQNDRENSFKFDMKLHKILIKIYYASYQFKCISPKMTKFQQFLGECQNAHLWTSIKGLKLSTLI